MKKIIMLISFIGLVLTILPSFFVFAKIITPNLNSILMIIGTLTWFISAPLWMKKSDEL